MKCKHCGVEILGEKCTECGWEPEMMLTSRHLIAAAIYGASVVAQVQEKWRVQCEAPDEDDMRRYDEEAQAVTDLWLEATLGSKR